jgi:hypothetical protein
VHLVAALPPEMPAGRAEPMLLAVEHEGAVALPAALPERSGRAYTVRFEVAWRRTDSPEAQADVRVVELRRDLPPGELLTQTVPMRAPPQAGDYAVEVTLRQVDGTNLTGPGNPVRMSVRVAR